MLRGFPARCGAAVVLAAINSQAWAQDRAADNAVTQAEDAFGFSVGRESIGIYNAGNVRGFSPSAAGNLRIDGLYFAPVADLLSPLVDSVSVKVGLSAQGYPFVAPSGIVDQALRKPADRNGASIVTNFDSYGSFGAEVDGSLVLSDKLAVAYGLTGSHVEFPDGTNNWNHGQSVLVRWRPAPEVELIPFWSLYNDYDDESSTFYIPSGPYLPKLSHVGDYEGPSWADFRFTNTNSGLLGSVSLGKSTVLRGGIFRSVNDQITSFTNLLANEQPDGSGERILIADPHAKNRSISGEVRLSHSILDGPRLHVFHLSVRERDARREFGGSEEIDLGPGKIGEKVSAPERDFHFGPLTHDRVQQTTFGFAYDGRWKNVGEVSFSVARAAFDKQIDAPGSDVVETKSHPLLYNGTLALQVGKPVIAYAGYARGLEESGTAPPNAANRNAPLPVIITSQKDAGVRIALAGGLKVVAGVFDLERPYFGFDASKMFKQVGTTTSRGAEFSISGPLTPKLSLNAGGVFLSPKVTRGPDVLGVIGSKPVGIPAHIINANFNWRTPLKGVELDLTMSHRGRSPARTDNLVFLPPRPTLGIGTHYRFKLASRDATLRLQVNNLLRTRSIGLPGSGIYGGTSPQQFVAGFLTVDL